MKQFTIPAGMRDLILGECETKKKIQLEIENTLDKWGYQEVVTPTIEYYKTYNIGFDDMQEEDMYKFFDASGKIIMLRADMTIPIARVVATKFKEAPMPLRFRYCADVFKVHEELSGLQNEISDCGVELIGVDEKSGDLEILATAMEALKVVKDKKCILEIGNVNYFREACRVLNLSEENISVLGNLIGKKSLISLEEYVKTLQLDKDAQQFFLELPWMSGDYRVLEKARKYAWNTTLNTLLDDLLRLYENLSTLGYENINFDLGKISNLNYYTGIIFEAFVEGVGTRIMSGGRYDTLIGKYGRDLPAVGFSIKLDALIDIVPAVEKKKKYIIEYASKDVLKAIMKSNVLREKAIVELKVNESLDDIVVKEED